MKFPLFLPLIFPYGVISAFLPRQLSHHPELKKIKYTKSSPASKKCPHSLWRDEHTRLGEPASHRAACQETRGAPSVSLLMVSVHIYPKPFVPRSLEADRQPALSWQPQLRKWLSSHVLNAFSSWGNHVGQGPAFFRGDCDR